MMKYVFSILIITLFIPFMIEAAEFKTPKTKKKTIVDNVHGYSLNDDYRWLENKDDKDVKEWSKAQHNYTVDFLKKNAVNPKGLEDEIRAYLDRDYRSSPFFKGSREFYYAKKKGDKQNKIYTVINGESKLIFDPMKLDTSGKTSISGFALTKDGNKAAVGVQFKGDEIQDFYIIDTKTGEVLGQPVKGLNGWSWTNDEKHAYISVRTKEMIKNQIPVKTYLHTIGEPRDKDVFLIAPQDAKNFASIWDTEEGGYTFTSEGDFYSNKLSIKQSDGSFKTIYESTKFRSDISYKDGKFYIYTNDNAPNFKLMVANPGAPEYENWEELLPQQNHMLQSYAVTSDYIITQEKIDALSKLYAYTKFGEVIKELELPELGDVSGISYHKESNSVFVSLSTFQSPAKLYKLNGKDLSWEFVYMDNPPVDTKDIESKVVYYKSKDGARIPLFIVHKKGIKLDGNNPTLLYGYGGFNIGMKPGFIGTTASFINRGGVYAIAGLRGGDEYGETWHNDGMLFKKQNTFDDFEAAARYLIGQKYTNPQKLAIRGGSNGGLLIGAAVTQHPELYKAAVCAVPLLDMLRYHKFLIARYWIPEYGDPDKKADYDYIKTYSPYQNIKPGVNYPAMLVKAGENDSRVDPLHAKKFAAALQNNPGQTNPIMLFVDFDSGHGSGQSTEQMVENISLEWRFIMDQLGMN